LNVTGFTPKQTLSVKVQAVVEDINGGFHTTPVQTTASSFTTNDSPVTNVALGASKITCLLNTAKNISCSWTQGTVVPSRINLRLYCKSPSAKRPFDRKAELFFNTTAVSTSVKNSYQFSNPPLPAKCEIKMGVYYTKSDNVNAIRKLKNTQEKVKFQV